MSIEEKRIKLNGRVELEGHIGTVKYVGPLAGADGEWVGVEWDDPMRGKHDGFFKGKRYFKASHPTGGSFVKAAKLNRGKSFVAALRDRYLDNFSQSSQTLLALPQESGPKKLIELVGFDKVAEKQGELNNLLEINLSNQKISYSGEPNELNELDNELKHVQQMDLSLNLFSSWIEIARILEHSKSLFNLILSKNKLQVPELSTSIEYCDFLKHSNGQTTDSEQNDETNPIVSRLILAFDSLKNIVFGKTGYNWDDVIKCAINLWPNIQSLDIWGNRINILYEPPANVFNELKYLDLSENPIKDWEYICCLGKLKSLESLHIAECEIESLFFKDCKPGYKSKLFTSLKHLNLRSNKIRSWICVSELNKLKNLEDLFIKNNPVFGEETYDQNYNFILARIEDLKVLNKEPITSAKRKDAELYYLKKFYASWWGVGDQKDEFLEEHPRYPDILSKYGSPIEGATDGEAEIMKRNFVTVALKCASNNNLEIKKRLPSAMSLINLKTLVKRLFKIKSNEIVKLTWKSGKDFECELIKNLDLYSITDGDAIMVTT